MPLLIVNIVFVFSDIMKLRITAYWKISSFKIQEKTQNKIVSLSIEQQHQKNYIPQWLFNPTILATIL